MYIRGLDNLQIAGFVPLETRDFALFSQTSSPVLGLTSVIVDGYTGLESGYGVRGVKPDHSPPSRVLKVTNECNYESHIIRKPVHRRHKALNA